jgi:hypothetical protein
MNFHLTDGEFWFVLKSRILLFKLKLGFEVL